MQECAENMRTVVCCLSALSGPGETSNSGPCAERRETWDSGSLARDDLKWRINQELGDLLSRGRDHADGVEHPNTRRANWHPDRHAERSKDGIEILSKLDVTQSCMLVTCHPSHH